jgi:hypothetical protein
VKQSTHHFVEQYSNNTAAVAAGAKLVQNSPDWEAAILDLLQSHCANDRAIGDIGLQVYSERSLLEHVGEAKDLWLLLVVVLVLVLLVVVVVVVVLLLLVEGCCCTKHRRRPH